MQLEKNWWINIILVPLLIGIIIAFVQYGLPLFFEKKTELSYSIEDPIINIDKNTVDNIDIKINNISTGTLIGQTIHVWNSGNKPIEKLPITYLFKSEDNNFAILASSHDTKPNYEFGSISLLEKTNKSRRYLYELLNPKDEFNAIFLVNDISSIELYAKQSGLNIKQESNTSKNKTIYDENLFVFFGMMISLLASFMTIILKYIKTKRETD
jgi:hypothetical protein